MCNIGDWREAIGEERGIERGIERGEEKIIFAFLKNSTPPDMAPEDIITMLCNSFGFSREVAWQYYEKYSAIDS